VLPSPKYQAPMNDPASMACAASSSMPPPKWAAAAPIVVSTLGVPSPPWPAEITPQPSTTGSVPGKEETPFEYLTHSQKAQKRAANRRSAQLSRKRKKQCVEELQEENDDLRRKEQILKSIPDLIVVFDSAGKVCFVSDSVSTFLNMTAKELEGTSFWNRLCEDSVRLLKAAFMDSLAAREPEADTVSLGSGVWELRLVDKDGSHTIVTLNGVVHFAGDRPECVCSMRPVVAKAANSSNTALETVDEPKDFTVRHHVKSEQSVVSSGSSTRKHKRRAVTSSNSSTDDSDSGSSDGMIQS
jgi:PAS domain S-box-containing protein